jgi:hypothetical protein
MDKTEPAVMARTERYETTGEFSSWYWNVQYRPQSLFAHSARPGGFTICTDTVSGSVAGFALVTQVIMFSLVMEPIISHSTVPR